MRNDLIVGRVIGGLDADDVVAESLIVVVDVLHEFQLGAARPHDQPLFGWFEGRYDLVIEMLIFGLTFSSNAALLVMQVMAGAAGRDVNFIDVVTIEEKHAGFAMIEPDDSVVVLH